MIKILKGGHFGTGKKVFKTNNISVLRRRKKLQPEAQSKTQKYAEECYSRSFQRFSIKYINYYNFIAISKSILYNKSIYYF